ncbi:hypothetical protein [Nocardiopsis ansamitocini]|uniref:Uncharacterized protein n=1 Tax=Nocardiopsis ansamitocini TaxID=1670832 RepID=A0A9W6UGF7_9ACTN|nr:hypothetical protein [Nocardiopsis ansamitocini]GLU47371.1 hypothetical protein Nans01_17220 [Nocardiopsis ansamitocini]
MSLPQLLGLLLALSVAVHVGCVGALVAWRGGARPDRALLVGASASGTVCALYLTAVGVYQ